MQIKIFLTSLRYHDNIKISAQLLLSIISLMYVINIFALKMNCVRSCLKINFMLQHICISIIQ
jgi:hypothetical protein